MVQKILLFVILFALIGVADAGYLTYKHYSKSTPPCSTAWWADCGKVLKSEYSMMFGVPLAMWGMLYYASVIFIATVRLADSIHNTGKRTLRFKNLLPAIKRWKQLPQHDRLYLSQLVLTSTGLLFSSYFVYLQVGVIGSICVYCMFSAANTLVLFGLTAWEAAAKA